MGISFVRYLYLLFEANVFFSNLKRKNIDKTKFKFTIPFEDSICEESGGDDETFSSTDKQIQWYLKLQKYFLHTRYYFSCGFGFITKKLTGTVFKWYMTFLNRRLINTQVNKSGARIYSEIDRITVVSDPRWKNLTCDYFNPLWIL